jgi:hypothetical protein
MTQIEKVLGVRWQVIGDEETFPTTYNLPSPISVKHLTKWYKGRKKHLLLIPLSTTFPGNIIAT